MAKTWVNFECTFNTANTVNALPDSIYFVTAAGMLRIAYVNIARAQDQLVNIQPSVCYLDADGDLQAAIMSTPYGADHKITVDSVIGDRIRVRVADQPNAGGNYIGEASRVPGNGMLTFDFKNDNGVLSKVHVGHAVKNLIPGKPDQGQMKVAYSRLEDARELFGKGVSPATITDIIAR